jgi:hypothetical protein
MRKCSRSIIAILIFIMALTAAGCANMRSFGKFAPDDNARTSFETFQLDPDYRYYITGSDVYPVAILALNKSYSMGNDLWKELSLTQDSLKEMVTFMQLRLMECCRQSELGFLVYAPNGKQIGTLYSYVGVGITFTVDDNGVVKMSGPRDDDQLKRYQQRTLR